MIDKKLKGGLTYKGAVETVKYLLNERVSEGTAKVIDGNKDLTLQLINLVSKKNKRSWSSGVLSFEETISEAVAKEIIGEHKRVTFCGMDEDQFNGLYVLHTDKERSELHYIFPRIELSTGKAYNPYYVKRDFKKKDLFQDYINTKYNLSSPKQSQSRELVTKNKKKWASSKSTIQKEIDEAVSNLVNGGTAKSRDDIIDFLRENGFEINRLRKGSISVLHESIKRKDGTLDPISLKGAIYGENFTDWGSLEESIIEEDQRARRTPDEIRRELDPVIRSQALYNAERFKARKDTEHKTSTPHQSHTLRNGDGLQIQESRRETESYIDEHKKESTQQINRKLEHDRIRAFTERRRAEGKRSREAFEDRKRRTFTRSKELAKFVHGINSQYQQEFNGYLELVSAQIDTVGKEVEQFAEAIRIESETERSIEAYQVTIRESSNRMGKWIGKKIDSIEEQIRGIGENLGGWLEDRLVRENIKQIQERRKKKVVKSSLFNNIKQVSFPKYKR